MEHKLIRLTRMSSNNLYKEVQQDEIEEHFALLNYNVYMNPNQ